MFGLFDDSCRVLSLVWVDSSTCSLRYCSFFDSLSDRRKTAIMPPKKQPEQPKKKKASAEDKVGSIVDWIQIDREKKTIANTVLLRNRPLV